MAVQSVPRGIFAVLAMLPRCYRALTAVYIPLGKLSCRSSAEDLASCLLIQRLAAGPDAVPVLSSGLFISLFHSYPLEKPPKAAA